MRLSSANVNHSPPVHTARGYKSPPRSPRPPAGGFVKIPAFAKINLFLDVLGKREDGYHNIVSVMQTVDLHDDIIIKSQLDVLGEPSRVQLSCGVEGIPTGENNLVMKAANALIAEYGLQENFSIELIKRIPVGAGLAGGSSNAAATLRGINELLGLNIPQKRLLEIGKSLGADVPFCLTGGTALTEGIGEKITVLPPHPPCFIVIACPNIHVSTADIFSKYSKKSYCANVSGTIGALMAGNIPQVAAALYNVFTPITASYFPEIKILTDKFLKYGALGASMSGTGSSVFGYFESEVTAVSALNRLKKHAYNVFLCNPI